MPNGNNATATERKNSGRSSLIIRIFNVYLLLTLTNLIVLWLASGANQVRLINRNALMNTQLTAQDLVEKLTPLMTDNRWQRDVRAGATSAYFSRRIQQLKAALKDNGAEFALLTADGRVLYQQFSSNMFEKGKINDEVQRQLYAAIQLRELKGQSYYGVPDVLDYSIELFIPFSTGVTESIAYYSRLPLASIRDEVRALIVLAVVMVGIILLVQTLFGFILYRMIVLPMRRLADGAERVSTGDLDVHVREPRRQDSIGTLINVFNRMVASLKDKTTTLQNSIDKLERHERLMRNELLMAQEIQRGIMPLDVESKIFRTSVYYAPMGIVSGDYYDIFALRGGAAGILLCDISGHGMPAALVSMMAKIHFSEAAPRYTDPAKLFAHVNEELTRAIPTPDYLTAFYMVIDKNRKLRFSNAANPRGIIFSKKEKSITQITTRGSYIGTFTTPPKFERDSLQLSAGDRVILYTDGLIDATNPAGEPYGVERLLKAVKSSPRASIDKLKFNIIEDLHFYIGENTPDDDQTLLIIEIL